MSERGALTLRFRHDAGGADLLRLAERDCAEPLTGAVLVAEVDGEALAAVRLADGRAVADPFRPTAHLVDLLHARRRQLAVGSGPRGGGLAATGVRLLRRAFAAG